ncbi:MAG: DUF433 domain-containing protein [Ignavibacteriales bacterium]|nr:DUF433 domain-containing protein [Ignavibacteriales bacterium]
MQYENYITIKSDVRFGKPCLKDTRISVYDVLSWMASGMSAQQITEDYPELTNEDILACLAYAAEKEHRIKTAV